MSDLRDKQIAALKAEIDRMKAGGKGKGTPNVLNIPAGPVKGKKAGGMMKKKGYAMGGMMKKGYAMGGKMKKGYVQRR